MKSGSHVSFGILLFALAAVACQQDGETARGLVSETRDSAGGGNGIRSHVLIGVQGVP